MHALRATALFFSCFTAAAATAQVQVTIDAGQPKQVIDHFGASDAWTCQFAGLWPDAQRNEMADLLFSMDTSATGQPKGIALSLWRFNLGAGSAEQGDASGIRDEWHRTESFLQKDGTYDWSKQAGQLWFLQAAKARKVPQFLAFINSPNVQFTANGKAGAEKGQCNILPAQYDASAKNIATSLAGVQKKLGITFSYFSPVNEPQWDWSDPKQEGCPYTNAQVFGVTKAVSKALLAQKLPAKILLTECAKMNYLYALDDKPEKGKQVQAFFGKAAPYYTGGLPNVLHTIASHSYFTTSPYATATDVRNHVAAAVAEVPGLKFWQSEYCILGDNDGEINGQHRDLGMHAALYMARVIHYDLAIANAASWQWWLAISDGDYKDGLVYIDKSKTGGEVHSSKMMWVLGNYSRFIRPGSHRISATLADSSLAKDLMVSAYLQGKELVTVVVNDHADPVTLSLHYKHLQPGRLRSYTTADGKELEPAAVADDKQITIPARAVVTLTGRAL